MSYFLSLHASTYKYKSKNLEFSSFNECECKDYFYDNALQAVIGQREFASKLGGQHFHRGGIKYDSKNIVYNFKTSYRSSTRL